MKKTPEEIKKGLEMCMEDGRLKATCPYQNNDDGYCVNVLMSDALAYIRQLEAAQPKEDMYA